MAKKPRLTDDLKAVQEYIKQQNHSIELDQEMIRNMTTMSNIQKQRLEISAELKKIEISITEYAKLRREYAEHGLKMDKNQEAKLKDIEKKLKQIQAVQQDNLTNLLHQAQALHRQRIAWEKIGNAIENSDKHAKSYWGYLMSADQAIRDSVKGMGAFGSRSEVMRDNMYAAAETAARLGVSVDDLSKMQGNYSEELGTQTILTAKNLQNLAAIAKSTNLSYENTAKLAAEFASIGGHADDFRSMIDGVSESSERMALNTTKVLTSLQTNFKAIQRYNFKQGVHGISDMAMYATKFKVDIQDALSSTERARTLEGAIDMMSTLQVLGGKFAEADPFEMLFLARNDPEKYAKKLNEMTKGMGNLVKTASGFEFQITALDRDRLKNFAEATGQDYGKVIEQAMKRAQIDSIRDQLSGLTLKDADRELIENMAQLDKKSGKFMVGTQKLADLAQGDIKRLVAEGKTLEQKAEETQNVNEAFKNTIQELKASLLPILNHINTALKWLMDFRNNFTIFGVKFMDAAKFLFKGFMAFSAGVAVFKTLRVASTLTGGVGGGMLDKIGGLFSRGGKGGSVTSAPSSSGGIGGGGSAKSIAAFGAAAAGAGAGIGLAAAGIGFMAEKFKELDPKQIDAVNGTITRLGLIMVGLSAGIVAVGMATGVAAAPMLAFGASVALIGAGVGIAAAGLGYFAEGIATVLTASKEVDGGNLMKVGMGIGSIGLGLTTMGNPLAMIGLASFAGLVSMIKGSDLGNTASSVANMVTTLKGSATELQALESMLRSISQLEVGENSVINKLSDLADKFDKGLKVEFAQKDVALNVNVTANLDSEPIMKKMNISERVKIQFVDEKIGRGSGRSIR